MSAIRISIPGQPVRHIDLGPATARLTGPIVGVFTGAAMIPPSSGLARLGETAEARAIRLERQRRNNAAWVAAHPEYALVRNERNRQRYRDRKGGWHKPIECEARAEARP